eukprot:jgi/Tetstr1/465684/TSEL_010327.t2
MNARATAGDRDQKYRYPLRITDWGGIGGLCTADMAHGYPRSTDSFSELSDRDVTDRSVEMTEPHDDYRDSNPEPSESSDRAPRVKVHWKLYFYTLAASMSELANGYDVGAFSFALLHFTADPTIDLTSFEVAVIVGMFNIVAALGCLLAGPITDWAGRKSSLIGGNLVNFVGTLLLAYARSFEVMFLGRFIMGLGAGIAFMGPELYASEISPPHVRGLTSTWGELFINTGILVGYVSGWALGAHWRTMVALGAIIPAVSVLLQLMIPESPRWMLQKGKEAEARAALRKVANYSLEQEQEQVDEIAAVLEAERGNDTPAWKELLCPNKALLHAMAVGWGVALFQQLNGSEAVVYYTPTVLKSVGVPDGNMLYGVTALVGLSKALFVAVALLSMDRTGRRPLLLVASVGVTIGLGMLAFAFTLEPVVPVLAAGGLCAFMAFFSVGWGPLTGVYLAEVFPLRIRGSAVGIGWALNRLTSGVVALVFDPMTKLIGDGGTFFFFAFIAAVSVVYSWFVVPETKGKTLEEINALFERRAEGGSKGPKPLSAREWEHAKEERHV